MIYKERMSIRLDEGERYILKHGCEATGLLPATFIRYLLRVYGEEKLETGIPEQYSSNKRKLQEKIKEYQENKNKK